MTDTAVHHLGVIEKYYCLPTVLFMIHKGRYKALQKKRGLHKPALMKNTFKTEKKETSVELPRTVRLQNRCYQQGSCCQTTGLTKENT